MLIPILILMGLAVIVFEIWWDTDYGILIVAAGSLMIAAGIGLLLIPNLTTFSIGDQEIQTKGVQEIEALNDGATVQGQFVLGTGTVNGEMRYAFIIYEDGFKTMKTMRAYGVYIDDTLGTGQKPYIEYREYVATDDPIYDWFGRPRPRPAPTVIHVPKGSVTTDFSIDLQ